MRLKGVSSFILYRKRFKRDESEDDFGQTVAVVRNVGFAKIHVFSFSPRNNTAAAAMQPKVKPEVIKKRSRILQALDTRGQADFRRQFTGEKVGVIVEELEPPRGRCERYFMVDLDRSQDYQKGQLVYKKLE